MDYFKIFLGALCLIAAICYQKYKKLTKNLPKPTFDLKEFWGKGDVKNYKEESSVKPFKVAYGDEVNINGLSSISKENEFNYLLRLSKSWNLVWRTLVHSQILLKMLDLSTVLTRNVFKKF